MTSNCFNAAMISVGEPREGNSATAAFGTLAALIMTTPSSVDGLPPGKSPDEECG